MASKPSGITVVEDTTDAVVVTEKVEHIHGEVKVAIPTKSSTADVRLKGGQRRNDSINAA